MNYETVHADLTYVTSPIDGRSYLVRNRKDKLSAANLLAEIRQRLIRLTDYLKTNYISDEKVSRLVSKFDPDAVSESIPNTSYTSYSVNKGEKIVFCLRAKDETAKLVDINTMMFVAIHELAHIMTTSVGHTEEFWSNMRYLLKKAIKVGVYEVHDYKNNPVKYCGIQITQSPLEGTDKS
jgi:leucyl aminopeptidase (aminopeptidase T)